MSIGRSLCMAGAGVVSGTLVADTVWHQGDFHQAAVVCALLTVAGALIDLGAWIDRQVRSAPPR